METIRIQKLIPEAKLPEKLYPNDSGYDVCALDIKAVYAHAGSNAEVKLVEEKIAPRIVDGELVLSYMERALIGTGLKIAPPDGYEVQVRSRGKLCADKGLEVVYGGIDSGYRGELVVLIINLSRANQHIKVGDKMAQLIITKVEPSQIEQVVDITHIKGDRGDKGLVRPEPKKDKNVSGFIQGR